jgi:uncharacterized membrane protein
MKANQASCFFPVFLAIILACGVADASGQTTNDLRLTELTLYRDGLVHCEQEIALDEFLPEVSLLLISESPQNILLLDENSTAVDYSIVGDNLTAFTLGAKSLSVEYDTMQLTRKEAEVWTLNTNYQFNMTVYLPPNSTIIYLNEVPLAIETTQENTIALSLGAGSWEISYVLPAIPPTANPTSTPDNSGQATNGLKIEYIALIAIVAGIIAVFGFAFFIRKRGPKVGRILKENPQLGKDDQEVIHFLVEKGGKAFEAELREKFPNMPRTSLWRLVRRLERLDIVEIKKIGLENQVQLKK